MITCFEDLNNLTDVDLRDIFEDIDFDRNNKLSNNKINNQHFKCPQCNSSDGIMEDNTYGIMACKCGEVICNLIDHNPEWRQYDDDSKNESRCGIPINKLLPQSSFGTTIAGR
jgi:hypothetical protein